jgi:hypothetical protein
MRLERVLGAIERNIIWAIKKFFSLPRYFISVIARKMSKKFSMHLWNVCISPAKLSMQSVAVKGDNKRCIATCLHLSVYETATHS